MDTRKRLGVLGLATGLAFLAACASSRTTSIAGPTGTAPAGSSGTSAIEGPTGGSGTVSATTVQPAPPTSVTARSYSSAQAVMVAIDSAGVPCIVTDPSAGGGGGAATIGFCQLPGDRLQAATFDNSFDQLSWLGLGSEVGKEVNGRFACDVGPNWAVCSSPGGPALSDAQRVADAIGGALRQYGT